jgi:hypothetical protein
MDTGSFIPPALMNPARRFRNDPGRCGGYALSMFTTRDTAVEFYLQFETGHKNIGNTLGTHLATGILVPSDGVATAPSGSGHFDLFEEQNCDLLPRFQIIEQLP